LNNGAGDEATMWVYSDGVGRPIFRTDGGSTSSSSFERIELDLAQFADGASEVRIEFKQASDLSGNYSGWNVDDFIFKDGTQPDYGACGDCGTAPSFAGAAAASDNDACGSTGVTVSYEKAVAWGTGTSGTYSIYRDTVPGFSPGPGNRIATGVTSLAYNDTTAPSDATLYYLVRAESDETCSTGPNNGGVTDANTVYAAVSETTSQPLPPEVGTVRVDLVAHSHVRLEWDAVADATSYRIYRATSPQPDQFGLLSETDGTVFEDVGEGANANTYYYKVVPVNACGQAGP
jgi:fibronectin type 3 domain-containing protein